MAQENTSSDVSSPAESSPGTDARRGFLEKCLGIIGSLGLLSVLYPVIRYLEPPPEAKGITKVEIDLGELPEGTAKIVTYRGRPALVVNGPDGFIAFNAVCSHLGCAVKWVRNDQQFVCPCHGGRFNLKGEVVGGPPPEPLVQIGVTVDGEKVVVGA